MKPSRMQSGSARAQHGAYAVEFAFVFLLAFALLYGAICYGMLFAFRLGLQNAAEDGARAALRYRSDLPGRRQAAIDMATSRADWMPGSAPSVDARICRAGTNACATSDCGTTWSQRCLVTVTVQTSDLAQVLPPLPGFVLPATIAGRASMLLDPASP